MKEKRTLIETFLPVEEISAESKKEKNGRAPTFELHYWWTRKPLIAARATVLGALLPEDFDVINFKHMIGLRDDQDIRAHNYDLSRSQLETLKTHCQNIWGTEKPTIMDPFAGGGSIPFEALKAGCDAIASDYNPLACLIEKATIEYPAKYGWKLLKDVEKYLNLLFNNVKQELEELYPKHGANNVSTYIYSWIVKCPDCGFENPLVGQWWLVNKDNKKIFLNPIIINNELSLEIVNGPKAPPKTVNRGKSRCLRSDCSTIITNEDIIDQIQKKGKEKLLAVVSINKNGKKYELPTKKDEEAIKKSEEILNKNWELFLKEDLIPTEKMPSKDVRSSKYLDYWHNILNPRQKLLFAVLTKHINQISTELNQKEDIEYAKAINTYLAILLGKHINSNCRLTSYHRSREIISGATSFRGLSMRWDHTEINPFIEGSGSLSTIIKSILKSLKYSINKMPSKNKSSISIKNQSITEIKDNADIIITDPPYFDDVQYAELSEFFYFFEKRALKNLIQLPNSTPKSEDLSVGSNRSKELFKYLFDLSCTKIHSTLSENGILIMYFAHSSVEAWDFVVNALKRSGFRITATWPIHTENPNNPLGQGNASILSSIVIVARKQKEDKTGYIEEIKLDVKKHLKMRLQEFWDYGLRGADITVAAMGASLDILTQYSEIKSYTGEMTVKDILELVEVYVVEYILEKFLKNSEGMDSPTRFYTYCRLSELNGMSFDTANLISKSLNINLKSLESSGNINSITTGRNKGIKLLKFYEREIIEVKSLIDAVQISMLAYDRGGMKEFESILDDMPYGQSEIFNILKSFQHLEPGDPEKQIALQILGKSIDFIPEKGQTTLD